MVKFTLKGISNLTESPAYFQQVNGIYRKDGALASLKLRDSEHFRYSQQTYFYKTVTDCYLFKLLRTKDRSITQLQVSSGESLYDENPYYSYKLAPLPQAPNQQAINLAIYYQLIGHALRRLAAEQKILLTESGHSQQLNYLIANINQQPITAEEKLLQSSYLFTALTLINKIPQFNDEIKAMMWQGQTVLDRLTTELNGRYCHLAKQQLLQLLTRCRSEVDIRSNNSHNSKSIELRRLYQAISSRHFDEEHIGATKLAAFVTLAMRLIRHKRQLTESKTDRALFCL